MYIGKILLVRTSSNYEYKNTMVTNRFVQRAIFNSLPRPCEVANILDDLTIGVGMLSDIEIVLIDSASTISVEFVVRIMDVVEAFFEVPTDTTFGSVSAVDVGLVTGENTRGLAAMMTPLELTSPSACKEPMPFC